MAREEECLVELSCLPSIFVLVVEQVVHHAASLNSHQSAADSKIVFWVPKLVEVVVVLFRYYHHSSLVHLPVVL